MDASLEAACSIFKKMKSSSRKQQKEEAEAEEKSTPYFSQLYGPCDPKFPCIVLFYIRCFERPMSSYSKNVLRCDRTVINEYSRADCILQSRLKDGWESSRMTSLHS